MPGEPGTVDGMDHRSTRVRFEQPSRALAEVARLGEQAIASRRKGIDALGDLFLLGAGIGPFVIGGFLVLGSHASPWMALAYAFSLFVTLFASAVLAWRLSGRPVHPDAVLRAGVQRCGGIGSLPATLGIRFTSKSLIAESERHVANAGLADEELEMFRTLLDEGYVGTLDELLSACRYLNA